MGLVFGEVQNCFTEEVLVNFVVRFRVQIQTDFLVLFRCCCQDLWLCICQWRLSMIHTNRPLIRFVEFLESESQCVVWKCLFLLDEELDAASHPSPLILWGVALLV